MLSCFLTFFLPLVRWLAFRNFSYLVALLWLSWWVIVCLFLEWQASLWGCNAICAENKLDGLVAFQHHRAKKSSSLNFSCCMRPQIVGVLARRAGMPRKHDCVFKRDCAVPRPAAVELGPLRLP